MSRRTSGIEGTDAAMGAGFHTTGEILLITGVGSPGAFEEPTSGGAQPSTLGIPAALGISPATQEWRLGRVCHCASGGVGCTTYARDGGVHHVKAVPSDLRRRPGGPRDELAGDVWFSLPTSAYGNRRGDWDIVLTDTDFQAQSRLVLPQGSRINGVQQALAPFVLGLAALNDRTLLAYLADTGEIVRLLRPGRLIPRTQDFWGISFARDLMSVK